MFNTSRDCEVSILVNGRPVTEVQFTGHTYIEGRKNSVYELQIRNKTPNRILAIPSVDGLNVLDGENCGVNSPGYVIDPWAVITIPGWMVDNDQAAKFQFKPQNASSSRDKTYSEEMGANPINQGMIGVMVFREKIVQPFNILREMNHQPYDPFKPIGGNQVYSSQQCFSSSVVGGLDSPEYTVSSTADSCADADEGKSLGTGFGEATEFKTQDTEFERASESPESVFVLYYDTIQGLKKLGVPVEQFKPVPVEMPNPFPASPNVTSGCKPPAGWNSTKYRK